MAMLLLGFVAAAGDRVAGARTRSGRSVQSLVTGAGVRWPVEEVYLRAFKRERQLELWGGPAGAPLSLLKTYPICAASGGLGPKRAEGDLQVPEGFYEVSEFNPRSNFHLSLKVSYPNLSDRVRGHRPRPGGLIYLHGNCVSIGCIAIEDEPMEEVYLVALDSKVRPIRFDIFPTRLTPEALVIGPSAETWGAFWKELEPGFQRFEATRRPAVFTIDRKTGTYRFSEVPRRRREPVRGDGVSPLRFPGAEGGRGE